MSYNDAQVWPLSEYRAAFSSSPTFDGSTINVDDLPYLLMSLGCTSFVAGDIEDIVRNKHDLVYFDDLVLGLGLFRDIKEEINFLQSLEPRRLRAQRAAEKVFSRIMVSAVTFVVDFFSVLAELVVNIYILMTSGFFPEDILAAKTDVFLAQFSTAVQDTPFGPFVGRLLDQILLWLTSTVAFTAKTVTFDLEFDDGVTCSGVNSLFVLPILCFVTAIIVLIFDSGIMTFAEVLPMEYQHHVAYFMHRKSLLYPIFDIDPS